MFFNIWVSNECNFRCKYCYEKDIDKNLNNNMNYETAQKIIAYIIERSSQCKDKIIINFHGGEPLLNFKIIKYIIECIDMNLIDRAVYYGITTNGLLLSEEIAKFIANKFTYNMSVSLDGNEYIHNLNRKLSNGQGTYSMVIDKILYLKELNPNVRARMTYNSETIASLSKSIEHIIQLGFTYITAVPDYSDVNWNDGHINILYKEMENIFDKYILNKNLHISFLEIDLKKPKGRCSTGKSGVNINYNGDIYTCAWGVGNKAFKIGDIDTGINQDKISYFTNLSRCSNPECQGCALEHWCIGNRCKIINQIITDDYQNPPGFQCMESHVIYKLNKKYNRL